MRESSSKDSTQLPKTTFQHHNPAFKHCATTSAMDANRQELMEIGADDFIGKPCREAELFQKIHFHVGVEYV